MSRCSTEAAALMQTGEDEGEDAIAWESVGLAKQMQGSQPPIQAVDPEVLSKPILQLVLALRQSVLSM